jgi:hypothetical protein
MTTIAIVDSQTRTVDILGLGTRHYLSELLIDDEDVGQDGIDYHVGPAGNLKHIDAVNDRQSVFSD